jgi:hypothetical protein
MMFPLRPLAALAAVALMLAFAAPVVSARATQPRAATPLVQTAQVATVQSTTAHNARNASVRVAPGALICVLLIRQLHFAVAIGNHTLANLLAQTLRLLGCGGAAI